MIKFNYSKTTSNIYNIQYTSNIYLYNQNYTYNHHELPLKLQSIFWRSGRQREVDDFYTDIAFNVFFFFRNRHE